MLTAAYKRTRERERERGRERKRKRRERKWEGSEKHIIRQFLPYRKHITSPL
jgi:hypothetical protein